jgi:catechol 2,3-dioxygenase-like lactoylglutathione lyase family enzyme
MTRLHHVQVACPVGGEDQARAFYGDLLGLAEVVKPTGLAGRGGVWFRGDGYELHIGVEQPFAPARKAHPAFLVDNIDRLARTFADNSIEPAWDENFPDFRRFHVFDPHGNRVEIMGAAPRP